MARVSNWFSDPTTTPSPAVETATPDVCIVGAGYTGLWRRYYLKRATRRCAS